MDSYTLNDELDNGEAMGLNLIEIIDGKKHLNDLCVVNSGYGPSYPCSWFIYDKSQNIIWKSGFEAGLPIGPKGRKIQGELADGD